MTANAERNDTKDNENRLKTAFFRRSKPPIGQWPVIWGHQD